MSLRSFCKYIDEHFNITAPLYNWRHMLDNSVDFKLFKEKFLASTGEHATSIICVSKCTENCRARQIIFDSDEKVKGVCQRRNANFFYVNINETAIYKLEINPMETLKRKDETPIQEVFPFARRHIHKESDKESEKWYVDGKLKKVYGPKKKNCMQSKILKILFNQMGNGWIPHQTFMNATGWNEEYYYGKNYCDSGRMQKLLFQLRQQLKVKILFSKKYGVRFSEEVVKSHIQSQIDFFKEN